MTLYYNYLHHGEGKNIPPASLLSGTTWIGSLTVSIHIYKNIKIKSLKKKYLKNTHHETLIPSHEYVNSTCQNFEHFFTFYLARRPRSN